MIIIGVSAFFLTYLGVAAVRKIFLQSEVLDIPNARSSHLTPIPRGGGLTIVIVTIIGSLILWYLEPHWGMRDSIILVLGGLLVAGISYWDDLRPLPYWIRLIVHIVVAGVIVTGIGYWRILNIPFLGQLDLKWFGLPITLLWIVGLINAYNFMDGIDGIAGGQGVIAGLGWAILGWISDQWIISGIGLVLAASCLGFLFHNWSPARIFMGDVGSAFLGYSFAVLPVVAARVDPNLSLAGVILVWPFIFDTFFTFLRRLLNHENVFTAHCSHIYQRLVATGYTHNKVASLYIGQGVIGLFFSAAWIMQWRGADYLIVIMLVMPFFFWLGTRWRERSSRKIIEQNG